MENKKQRKAERNRIYYLENKEKTIQHQKKIMYVL